MTGNAPDIRLVIFDCDGVLIDSEPLAIRLLRDTLKRRGLDIPQAEAYRRFLGRSLAAMLVELETENGLKLGSDDLDRMRHELADLFRAELKPIPHIAEAVATISRTRAVCVASSSLPERLTLSLTVTGLLPLFEGRVFSATEVEHGKPAPDLFLHAARTMGVAPEHCLVVEDSVAGIRAAQAAGMRVFGFTGGSHAEDAGLETQLTAERPDRIFADMRELPGLIETPLATPAGRPATAPRHLIAVDVGTASVRAGLVTPDGSLLARAEQPITPWRHGATIGEYASEDIWRACCRAVRGAVTAGGVTPDSIAGIGFDATCSLVFRDRDGKPLSISVERGAPRDTIAWFDHRALDEAIEISATGHRVLGFSGGALSPEMEIPKLMWLKRRRPEVWAEIGAIFDLADYLTWRASGTPARSQSTLTAKWTFLAHETPGWRDDFLALSGLEDLKQRARLPEVAAPIGTAVGRLTPAAAEDLGLPETAVVATAMVDAHAGALGLLGGFLNDPQALETEMALVAGTSSCIIAMSSDMRPIRGIWGPYYGAAAPGFWLNEGGQSATGALLDHIIREHADGGEPTPALYNRIVERISELRADPDFAKGLTVIPDHHGNRSPFHDPLARGAIIGLGLDSGFDGLCALYWRAAVGIAMNLRQIVEVMRQHGHGGERLHIAGGHAASPLLQALYADATGLDIVTYPKTPLLTGMAMGVSVAAGLAPDLVSAGKAMRPEGTTIHPRPDHAAQYDADYETFLKYQRLLRE